ncbi:PepSY-like domain-containing protein [Costertonia aggregata]|uniref:PepSY-like domain-containing protein n=1 Tax=Costertonia aggregata TaxID=343403 RepID=A0A7H9AQJ9_9FLAO|nr:PepSY-like domain-containing protein [Costertonia aggregata]QLG45728.1 PepSY-like domain-containing protein [Costertonia aggregata]
MKFFLNVLFALISLNMLSCQRVKKSDVPKAVKATFEAKYPGEDDPDWRLDRNDNFESHFKINGEHYRADFSPNGNWIETERNIKKKELPKIIREKLKSDYDDYKIVEIEVVDHHSKGIFYDVELKKDGKKQDIEFTIKGEIIN